MNYQDIVDIARRARPLNRIKILGSQTGGYLKCDPEPEKLLTTRYSQGTDYAKVYQLQDELEDFQRDGNLKNENQSDMNAIECLSSLVSCVPDPLVFESENLVKVYDNYSFNIKTESSLLINSYRDEILNQIEVSPVTIIKGQTGCGKTTQVPQFILDNCASKHVHCNIVVTQPRRIATISIAKRVCAERNWKVGSIVGYQIALDKAVTSDTRLVYCTTGVLLNQLISRQSLSQYTHIIIDEVHERDQETDFLLIIVKRFLRTPGCRTKVILMSATINTQRYSDYFSKKVNGIKIEPPIVELEPVAKYPVYYYYLDSLIDKIPIKIPEVSRENPQIDTCAYDVACVLVEAFTIIDKNEHKQQDFIGSVLIFLPGIHEIDIMYEKLSNRNSNNEKEKWWLCPLHSSVTFDEQMKVFKNTPKGWRKIILATNIAESSITVPDVKYVIDFCLIKLLVQESDTNFSSLQLSWISKSQANQRAGRVGRVMPGRVYRLITHQLYEELEEDCFPEMLRSPLDQVVLRAKSLNIGSPVAVLGRALDPPDLSNIQRTVLNLKEMGALLLTSNGKYVDDDGDLTFIGEVMTKLPLDTRLSKLIILGHMFSLLSDAVIMASAMSVKSMFSAPFRRQLEAYNSKLSWADSSCSDPIAFLNAYKVWRYHKNSGKFSRSGGSTESDWAKRYFIQLQSMRDVARLEGDIMARLNKLGIFETTSGSRVAWNENVEKPLILKLAIAGAFYPNYFLKRQADEMQAVRTLGGRDPFSSVYLTGMPSNQPGPLYASAIKKKFEHCGSQITVSFDGSCKVYLQFGSSTLAKNEGEDEAVTMPGKIIMAVYRAIKLRHLQIPISIPMLQPNEAQAQASKVFGEYRLQTFCWSKQKGKRLKNSILPGLAMTYMEVTVCHVETPSKFWVQLNDDVYKEKKIWMHDQLNNKPLIKLKPPLKLGSLCVAPYRDENKWYYRARIKSLGANKSSVFVYFVDYGNSEWVEMNELMDFTPEMIKCGVKDDPEMALECTLSEIQPSLYKNPKGSWSKDISEIFKQMFLWEDTIIQVYSVVGNVMSVTLFMPKSLPHSSKNGPDNETYNDYLLSKGYAEPIDEPYLSRENHMIREMASNSPELMSNFGKDVDLIFNENADVESPPEKECRLKVNLKGPKSPLEMSLYSVTQKSRGMDIVVEWNSVNSVLLDTYPMDHHERMLVAASVTQSASGDRLTLRNTTMLPNIHGLASLIPLIFAPRIQLRTDEHRTQLTGAICGLGYESSTKIPYYSENDIEVCFDTMIDHSDLENINRLRYWMNSIVFGGLDWEQEISRPKVAIAQKKIRHYITALLGKKRPSMRSVMNDRPFEWGQIDEEELMHPRGLEDRTWESEEEPTIFPLIWGIRLNMSHSKVDIPLLNNLKQLQAYADGKETMRSGLLCKLCQVYLTSLPDLRLHLQTSVHRESYRELGIKQLD